MKRLLLTVFAAVLLSFTGMPQDRSVASPLPGGVYYKTITDSGVSFAIVPFYVWVPGFTGNLTVGGVTANIDFTPFDVIENLGDVLPATNVLYSGAGEVRYDRFGFMYDVWHWNVSSARSIDRRFIQGGVDVGFKQTFVTLVGAYRVMEMPTGYVDVLAGARIWDVNAKVGVNLRIAALTTKAGDTWFDPLIGANGRMNLNENWYLTGWGLVGGLVTGSDFMWDVCGNLGYQMDHTIDFFAGMRATGTDYSTGGFVFKGTQWGPTIGATIKLN